MNPAFTQTTKIVYVDRCRVFDYFSKKLRVGFVCRYGSRTGGWKIKGSVWQCPGHIQQIPVSTPIWWRTRLPPEVCHTLSIPTCLYTTIRMLASQQQPRQPLPQGLPRHLSLPPSALSILSARFRILIHAQSCSVASGIQDCTSHLQASIAQRQHQQRLRQQLRLQQSARPRPLGPAHVSVATAVKRQVPWAQGAPALTSPALQPARGPRADFCHTQLQCWVKPQFHRQIREKRALLIDNSSLEKHEEQKLWTLFFFTLCVLFLLPIIYWFIYFFLETTQFGSGRNLFKMAIWSAAHNWHKYNQEIYGVNKFHY